MKKHLTVILCMLFIAFSTSAAFTPGNTKPLPLNASQIMIQVGKPKQQISLKELSSLSISGLENLTGKKMGFMQRNSFKLLQKKLKKSIAANTTISSEKQKKQAAFLWDRKKGFHAGGFVLGFFLNVFGLLIAYNINDEYKQSRIDWAWIGLAFLLSLILFFGTALLIVYLFLSAL